MTGLPTTSFAEELAALVVAHPHGSSLLAETLASLTDLEAAALAYDWAEIWRRPKQTPPSGPWQSWGALTGRGFGKSLCNANWINGEAMSGRAMRIALIAQNEDKCLEVMVHGESGLLAVSPPWFEARFESGHVYWPNGAQAFIYTPHVPKDIFGPEHHAAWASELHAWPPSTRDEAWANLLMGLRLGYGRLVWDSNPAKRHPIIDELLAEAEADPVHHVVVRGSSHENALNLTPGIVEKWEKKYGGTQRGREMIYGEQLTEDEGALWKQDWIDRARRGMPAQLRRRILSIDPAISTRAGTDATGIVDLALDTSAQVYVCDRMSDHYAWEAWGELLVRLYFERGCDCIVIERNRGGDACTSNVRAAALAYGRRVGREIRVEVVKDDAPTRHAPTCIYVKEVVGRNSKGTRAEPVATHYEAGRVSHVEGVALSPLEDLLTTWVPDTGGESPNELDALVHGVVELAGLARESKGDGRAAISGASAMAATMAQAPRRHASNVASLLAGGQRGGRI